MDYNNLSEDVCLKNLFEIASKSVDGQPSVGSNPTRSATKALEMLSFQGFSSALLCLTLILTCQNGAHGALICGAHRGF